MPRTPAALRPFHPLVRRWFAETLGAPSEPQRRGWPAIASGEHTLILAPTGTGKTLSAFLWELNQLIAEGHREPLPNAVQILYVSPLKALNNDIQRNLERPLAELRARFEAASEPFPEIRVAVRTGDTPASARARMLRKSPHILITTPESLNIMLTTERGRGMFASVRVVIVDEIHAVAGTKRGAHLALTLERLDHLVMTSVGQPASLATPAPRRPQRIGLSATQRPLEEIARFLGGMEEAGDESLLVPRPVTVVDCGAVKAMELRVISPVADMGEVGGTIWPKVVDVVHQYVRDVRTTLVFVNNRAQAERIAARLNAQAEEELAQPYHGSLSRERRFALEGALKAGELRVLVATSSLELGIDIGSVDLVIQLQSPKRVASALQRVGRAGHTLGAVSRGILVPTFRDDLVEITAIVGGMKAGDVEPTRVPQNALDVVAQVIVAAVSADDWTSAALFDLVRGAYPYHRLSRAAFDEVLSTLSGKYPADLAAELEPRITWDRVTDRLSGSRGSRMMAMISGGTIPDRGLYTVALPDRTRLGELDEEFVHESRVGDVFQLGSSTWRIGAIEHDRVIVQPAPGAPARMPFWHGEYMARSVELSRRVGALRRELAASADREAGSGKREAKGESPTSGGPPPKSEATPGPTASITDPSLAPSSSLAERYGLDPMSVESLRTYIAEQRAVAGVVPDDRTLLIEHFRDELGAVRIVLHSIFGGRVNAPWGMALAQRVREELGVDVQVQTSDDGVMLRLPDLGTAPPLHALSRLSPEEAERRVLDEVGTTSLFGARFRMNAARALLLPRGSPKRRMPLWLQRLKALDLLETVRQFPSFPILVETYREILQDAFDLDALKGVLAAVADGSIQVRVAETEVPSPFAASLQFGFVVDWLYGDDTPRAERKAALLSLDRALLDDVMGVEGGDDDTLRALEETLAERRGTAPGRRARSADELAHLLDRAGDLTEPELRERVGDDEGWKRGDPLVELLESGRALAIRLPAGSAAGAQGEGVRGESVRGEGARGGGPPPDIQDRVLDAGAHHHPDAWRIVLAETYPRYAAAYGAGTLDRVRVGAALAEREAADVLPDVLRAPAMEARVARREILSRYLALSGPVTVAEIRARYGWPDHWIEARLTEWQRTGRLVRGRFRREIPREVPRETPRAPAGGDALPLEWCSRKIAEIAKRRALAALRKQIEAVDLSAFAAFLQRWQHADPRDRLDGPSGVELVLRQLEGLPRGAAGWERDYLPARLRRYDPAWLAQLGNAGGLVWAGGAREDKKSGTIALGALRFFRRGEAGIWMSEPAGALPLSDAAVAARDALERLGASFVGDLQAATGASGLALRDALRELVAAGIATNDTIESLREVIRMRPLPDRARRRAGGAAVADPTRWLPADFTPSENRYVVQRRANVRRLPKWRRPDVPGIVSGWVGRWSLVRAPGTWGEPLPEDAHAELVARQWLDRYGVVTRDWWRRERPPVPWRAIYRELKRLEYRGEVRRGYFVRGLAGAQFALPEAVERVRAAAGTADDTPMVALAAGDPANPYNLPLEAAALDATERDPLSRPRGGGAWLVTWGGRVALSAEGRGRRIGVAPWLAPEQLTAAARALAEGLLASPGLARRARDITVATINGVGAAAAPQTEAFRAAGYRITTDGLRYFAEG